MLKLHRDWQQVPNQEEAWEIARERMRKRWSRLREQEDYPIQQIHENIGNSSSHFSYDILHIVCIRKYGSRKGNNGEWNNRTKIK